MNATGIRNPGKIKIHTYSVYKKNFAQEGHAGIAVAMKNNIQHNITDTSEEDLLAIQIETIKGTLILATTYEPPRRNYLPVKDLTRLL